MEEERKHLITNEQAHQLTKAAFTLYRTKIRLSGRDSHDGIFHWTSEPTVPEVMSPDAIHQEGSRILLEWYGDREHMPHRVGFEKDGTVWWNDTNIVIGSNP